MDSAPTPEPKESTENLSQRLKNQLFDKVAGSDRFRNWVGFIFILAGLLSTIAAVTIDGAAADLTGRFGIWSTAALFALFGKAAYLFGPALILSGLRGLKRDDWQTYVSGILGNLSLLWGSSVFLQLSNQIDSGILGEQTGYLLEFFTGRTGSYLIDIILIFAGILLLLQIPFDQVKQRLTQFIEGTENKDSQTSIISQLNKLIYILPIITMIYEWLKKNNTKKTNTEPNQTQPANTESKTESMSTINSSSSRPPWIQKVILTDSTLDKEEIPTQEVAAQVNDNQNRWRPGEGFDIIDSSASLKDWNHSLFDQQLDNNELESKLIIEEDRFLILNETQKATAVLPKPTSLNPRIVFDQSKNRYLFTTDQDTTENSNDLLGRLEIDDSIQLFEKKEMNQPQKYSSADIIENKNFNDDDLQNQDVEVTVNDFDLNQELTIESEHNFEPEFDDDSVEVAVVSSSKNQTQNRPIVSDVVFSENRFSKYRLSRRIAKQTDASLDDAPEAEIRDNWQRLEKVMSDFGIQAKVVGTIRGPMITMYEVQLEPGIRVNRILNIENEIRMNLAALSVRILAPIPGKSTIGIELPNRNRKYVSIGDLANGDPEFTSNKRQLPIALGKDITGTNRYLDLTRLPHLLIAGATGSGKSVFMNSVIGSLLFNRSPDEVRFLMIDPKMVELKLFEGIPHLLYPVITDVRLADRALQWAVQEMENRYQLLSSVRCRDILSFNDRVKNGLLSHRLMPYIVVLIDELSDLMMVAAKEVEDSIIRLTQKARAVGIHVIMATQRPSVDVITALIKANCPARISFQVSQRTDSRVILDTNGAEALLGRGDMLYKSPTAADPARIQSPMISDQEIEQLVSEAGRFGQPRFIDLPSLDSDRDLADDHSDVDDSLLENAWQVILDSGKTSTSYLQRRLRIGYNRAATLMERLEQLGYVSEPVGNRPREILKRETFE
ncbi:MAG: DNA translocase FtsK 4TM domain-containing protein [Leptonema sp. (in: Bacteria)]|nr:DNA translocase FtsK 4TM domain-containing protein [Leptonema sp. (in: bacteria)]